MSNNQTDRLQRFADMFKALSNPNRLRIYLRLSSCCEPGTRFCGDDQQSRECVGELGKDLGIVPSTVSHHIKELGRAGLIRMERRGQNVECWVDPEALDALSAFFNPKDA